MTRVVEANTAELRTLTARLEDERHRSLMQIEQARQQVAFARQQAYRESEQKMAKLETELRSEIAVQTVEIHRWQKRSSELEEKNAKLTEQLAKEIRATPASTKKRKPALKSAPGRTRRLKGRRTAI